MSSSSIRWYFIFSYKEFERIAVFKVLFLFAFDRLGAEAEEGTNNGGGGSRVGSRVGSGWGSGGGRASGRGNCSLMGTCTGWSEGITTTTAAAATAATAVGECRSATG